MRLFSGVPGASCVAFISPKPARVLETDQTLLSGGMRLAERKVR